jgi:TP901 family phage tail tape measure protein
VAWNTAGATLTGFGAAALGGLALATKAAMDWESAWAGVQKTVDGTAPQMASLEAGLRGMARELPASHQEIAAVAEAAGQLGIATPNILSFTRTMIDMGESTNLSADEAATALARFITVTGTSQQDIGRLGATVVGLGNNFATTEGEIVALSQRLAAAGTQAGLSEGEIMGLATAMSQVGIEAEAGGSAMTQTMNRISRSVEEGGESLDLFAAVSGMTSEQFATAWETRPAEALVAFTEGLADTSELGMSTNGVLTELGITGLREADTMRRLALATGTMSDAMAMGNSEFEKGTALIEEASKRYETAESRIAMAKNALVDMGISIGGVVLPAVADLAEGAGDLAGWFADLPEPVQQAAAGLGAVVGGASLAAGSFLLLFPRVMDTVSAFQTLKTDMPGVAGGLGKVGKAAGVAGLALAGIGVVDSFRRSFIEAGIGADEYTASLINLAETSDITRASFDKLYAETLPSSFEVVNDFGSALRELDADGFTKFADELATGFGMFGNSVRDDLLASMEQADQAMVSFVQGGALDHMVDQFNAATESAEAYEYSAADVMDRLPGLRAELTNLATDAGLAADDQTLLKIATGELVPVIDEATGAMSGVEGASGEMAAGMDDATGAVEEQVDALAELQDLLSDTADLLLGVRGSERDFEAAIDDATASLEEHGKTLDRTTEAGRANEAALDGIAESAHNWANKAEEAGATASELDSIMQSGRDNFIRTAEAMGMSTEEATRLADELQLIPDFVETEVKVETEQAGQDWDAFWSQIGDALPEIPVGADTSPAEEEVRVFGSRIGDATPHQVIIDADTYWAQSSIEQFYAAMMDQSWTVEINGETVDAQEALAMLVAEINEGEGYVSINGTPVDAESALLTLVDHINNSGGTVEIDADGVPAILKTQEVKRQADNTTGTIDVDANTGEANSDINSAARDRNSHIDVDDNSGAANSRINNAARNRRMTITVGYSDPGFQGSGGGSRFATGGPVFGPGTGTSDSIRALLSNGEHVLTAAEVALAGGHDSVLRMRAAIRAGALRFADGGGVENGAAVRMSLPATPSWGRQPVSGSTDSRPSLSQTNNIYGPDPNEVTDRAMAKMRHFVSAQAVQLPS